jgi:hypothetical protein
MEYEKILKKIVEDFETGKVAANLGKAAYPCWDVPCARWSFLNRILCAMNGTADARGFLQWKQAGRFPRKGTHGFFILSPIVKQKKGKEEGKDDCFVAGFKTTSVHPLENTDGEPLEYQRFQAKELPLASVAKKWGIPIVPTPKIWGWTGVFETSRTAEGQEKIRICSEDEKVFFHELAHAAHKRHLSSKGEDILEISKTRREVVADLASEALVRIVGGTLARTAETFAYIQAYSALEGKTAPAACLSVLAETGKVLELILAEK